MADDNRRQLPKYGLDNSTNMTKVRESNLWQRQMQFMKNKNDELERQRILAARNHGAITPLWKAVPGDTRAMKVLASLYDDPMLKAFIQAAQLPPG